MAKLKPDYINWVLTLNATQAQEEFHKLEKANKELQKQTNASRKAMAQLEAEGKKGSTEWNNLRKSIDQNSRAMAQNRAMMQEVSKRFDFRGWPFYFQKAKVEKAKAYILRKSPLTTKHSLFINDLRKHTALTIVDKGSHLGKARFIQRQALTLSSHIYIYLLFLSKRDKVL